jgi:hypothetical protein
MSSTEATDETSLLLELARVLAFRSRCSPDRKHESQRRVSGCCASRNRLLRSRPL